MIDFEHNGVTVAFNRKGTGPGVLFLHNGGTSSAIWRNQVNDLSSSHTTVAVDLPGFGDSPRPPEQIDLDDHVELVAALIEAQELAPVLLVGNCMGSNIAALLAARRPELVRGLVLVNPLTAATFSAGKIGMFYTMQRWAPGPSSVARRVSRAIVPPKVAAKATLRFQVGSKGVAAKVHHDPELIACGIRRDQMPALIDVLDNMDAYGTLDSDWSSTVPLCTIWGAQNNVLSPKAGGVLGDRLQPDRAVTLGGCGHLPMLEDPDAVTAIIEEFDASLDTLSQGVEMPS